MHHGPSQNHNPIQISTKTQLKETLSCATYRTRTLKPQKILKFLLFRELSCLIRTKPASTPIYTPQRIQIASFIHLELAKSWLNLNKRSREIDVFSILNFRTLPLHSHVWRKYGEGRGVEWIFIPLSMPWPSHSMAFLLFCTVLFSWFHTLIILLFFILLPALAVLNYLLFLTCCLFSIFLPTFRT